MNVGIYAQCMCLASEEARKGSQILQNWNYRQLGAAIWVQVLLTTETDQGKPFGNTTKRKDINKYGYRVTRKTFNLQEDMISKEVRNHNLAAVVTSSITNKGLVISDTEMRKASDPVKLNRRKK